MDRRKSRFTYAAILPMAVLLGMLITGLVPGDSQGIAQDISIGRDEICALEGDEQAIAEVHEGRFCTFSAGPSATCQTPIEEQLVELDARMADERFELIDYGQTHLGNRILAARIGNLADASPENPTPQIVLVGAQHAREWISAQIMMELIYHFAEGAGSELEILNEAVITIMPVNNPDGYNYSFTDERFWRTNRWECDNGNVGVDPNRNYPMTYTEPGNDPDCETSIYRGPAPGSEPETTAGRNLIASTESNGAFQTTFVLNVHAFGNLVLFPDGLSQGFEVCSTNTNCTSADLGALRVLGGTRAFPKFVGERGLPFRNGQTYRSIYAASGDLTADAMFGELPNDAPNPMSITLEIGDSRCGFQAEFYSEAQYQLILDQQIAYVEHLVDIAPELLDGSYYDNNVGTFTLPHIHRRLPDLEHPTLRVAARNTESHISAAANNSDRAPIKRDELLEGVAYTMWRWNPTIDPFEFPTRMEVCPGQLFYCRELVIGGTAPSASTTTDLCDPNRLNASGGWEFVARQGAYLNPSAQCYWKTIFEPNNTTTRTLEMNVSLNELEESTLTFSYYHGDHEVSVIAQATTGEFRDCGYRTGVCRTLFNTQWRGSIGWVAFSDDFIPDSGFRTEIIDLSDYDGQESVKIRIQLVNAPLNIGIFDPVVTGWVVD